MTPAWDQYDLHSWPARVTCRRCTWAVWPLYRAVPLDGLVQQLTDHEHEHQPGTVGRQRNE